MSSHHIIRDKQEPALIIANGEECSMDLLEQLLEWSPTVVVLDGAIQRVIDLGIKFYGVNLIENNIEQYQQFPKENP